MVLAGATRDMPLVTLAFNDRWSVCVCVVGVATETGMKHCG